MTLVKKILLVTKNFPPSKGGMEGLSQSIGRALSKRHEVTLIAPVGAKNFLENVEVIEVPLRPLPLFFLVAFVQSVRAACGNKYHYAVGCSGLVAPIVYFLGKLFGSKTLLFVHGLDVLVDSKPYQWFFLPLIRRVDEIIANSSSTREVLERYGVSKPAVHIVNPAVSIDFTVVPSTPKSKQLATLAAGRPVLLSVGRLIERKGLEEFVVKAMPPIQEKFPDVLLLIVGEEPAAAMRSSSGVKARIEKAVFEKGLQNNVVFTGAVSAADLKAVYLLADVFVFPLVPVPGDMEGFGMVAVEAALAGKPVAAFKEGGGCRRCLRWRVRLPDRFR